MALREPPGAAAARAPRDRRNAARVERAHHVRLRRLLEDRNVDGVHRHRDRHVNDANAYQTWEGFGGAFNEKGWSYLTSQR